MKAEQMRGADEMIVRSCGLDETNDLREWADPKSRLRETPMKKFIAVRDDGRTATIDVLVDAAGLTAGDIKASDPIEEEDFMEIRLAVKILLHGHRPVDGCFFTPLGWKVMSDH